MENKNTNNQATNYSFLNAVHSNKSYFHKREIIGAGAARILLQLVGWPSTQSLKGAVEKKQIRNCPITIVNISLSQAIYGTKIPTIHGKIIRRRPEHKK